MVIQEIPFKLYITIAIKNAIALPDEGDRRKALKWIQKIQTATEEGVIFINYHVLKLLMECLQRKRLVGPFESDPDNNKALAQHGFDYQPADTAEFIHEKEEGNRNPTVTIELSTNFHEFLANHTIPALRTPFILAFSPDNLTKWDNLDKFNLTRGMLQSTVIAGDLEKSVKPGILKGNAVTQKGAFDTLRTTERFADVSVMNPTEPTKTKNVTSIDRQKFEDGMSCVKVKHQYDAARSKGGGQDMAEGGPKGLEEKYTPAGGLSSKQGGIYKKYCKIKKEKIAENRKSQWRKLKEEIYNLKVTYTSLRNRFAKICAWNDRKECKTINKSGTSIGGIINKNLLPQIQKKIDVKEQVATGKRHHERLRAGQDENELPEMSNEPPEESSPSEESVTGRKTEFEEHNDEIDEDSEEYENDQEATNLVRSREDYQTRLIAGMDPIGRGKRPQKPNVCPSRPTVGQSKAPCMPKAGPSRVPKVCPNKPQVGQPTVGQPRTTCRPIVGQVQPPCKPTVGQARVPGRPTVCQPKPSNRQPVGQPKAVCRPTVGQPNAPCRPKVGQPNAPCRPTIGQPNAPCRPNVGYQQTPYKPRAPCRPTDAQTPGRPKPVFRPTKNQTPGRPKAPCRPTNAQPPDRPRAPLRPTNAQTPGRPKASCRPTDVQNPCSRRVALAGSPHKPRDVQSPCKPTERAPCMPKARRSNIPHTVKRRVGQAKVCPDKPKVEQARVPCRPTVEQAIAPCRTAAEHFRTPGKPQGGENGQRDPNSLWIDTVQKSPIVTRPRAVLNDVRKKLFIDDEECAVSPSPGRHVDSADMPVRRKLFEAPELPEACLETEEAIDDRKAEMERRKEAIYNRMPQSMRERLKKKYANKREAEQRKQAAQQAGKPCPPRPPSPPCAPPAAVCPKPDSDIDLELEQMKARAAELLKNMQARMPGFCQKPLDEAHERKFAQEDVVEISDDDDESCFENFGPALASTPTRPFAKAQFKPNLSDIKTHKWKKSLRRICSVPRRPHGYLLNRWRELRKCLPKRIVFDDTDNIRIESNEDAFARFLREEFPSD